LTTPPPTILLVEDNDDDVFFMRRAVARSGIECSLQIARDGQQAIDYLEGRGQYADRDKYPLPTLVFLDLKLPYIHGFEVLTWIREQPHLKDLCILILTSSPEERDRQRAAQLNAKAFYVKPPTPEMIIEAFLFLNECDVPPVVPTSQASTRHST
jgi:CheY-like chemotaxis protein